MNKNKNHKNPFFGLVALSEHLCKVGMALSLRASSHTNAIPLFTSTIVVQALESKNPGCCHNLKNLFLCYNKKEMENVF